MGAYDAERWADFAVGMAGAAAALAGLVFVAVSINIAVIVQGIRTPGRAAQALLMLVTPVFLSLCVLVPDQGPAALGGELIAVGVLAGSGLLWIARPSSRPAEQPVVSWVAMSLLPSAVLLLAPLMAGVGLLTESLGGLYWVPGAVGIALLGGLGNAWVLLIEVQR